MFAGPAAIDSRVTSPAKPLVVVGDLERPETELADVQRLGRIGVRALPAAKPDDITQKTLLIGRALAPGAARRLVLVVAAFVGPDPSAALDDWPQVWTTARPASKHVASRRALGCGGGAPPVCSQALTWHATMATFSDVTAPIASYHHSDFPLFELQAMKERRVG